jgi:hypothetical protein
VVENNYSTTLLSEAGLRTVPGGLDIDVRLPWYRSMPLSVVEVAELSIDGAPVDTDAVRLEVNGRGFALSALPEITGEVWYVLDSATLHVAVPLERSADHLIELTLNLYPPYIPGLIWVTKASRTLRRH